MKRETIEIFEENESKNNNFLYLIYNKYKKLQKMPNSAAMRSNFHHF